MLEAKREGAVWRFGKSVPQREQPAQRQQDRGGRAGQGGEMEWGLRGSEGFGLHAE